MGLVSYIRDSLHTVSHAGIPAADSLPGRTAAHIPDSLSGAPIPHDSVYTAITAPDPALHVFGEGSRLDTADVIFSAGHHSFTQDVPYQLAVLAMLAFFLYVMTRYRAEALQLFRLMFGRKREGRSADDQQSVLSAFVNYMAALFIAGLGIAVTRGFDVWTNSAVYDTAAAIPDAFISFPLLIALAVMLAAGVIMALQLIILKAAGSITFNDVFIGRLLWQRRIFTATLAVAAVPLAIVMAMASVQVALWLGYALLTLSVIMTLWFAVRSLKLFMEQKVSILFWFLYLCAVEIMPVSFFVLFAARGFEW